MRKRRAVGLLSFGLDSRLAYAVMKRAGFEIQPVYIDMGFCACDIHRFFSGWGDEESIYENLIIIDAFNRFKDILINPRFGYGKNLNPCIDCKIMMFMLAREIMEESSMDLIFTGEVKGQRMMSQINRNMNIIEREAGTRGKVFRPLSAKLFEPVELEREGLIEKSRFYGFFGKSRKPQIKLAEALNIRNFPSPSGGCLLTYRGFSRKAGELLSFYGPDKITRQNVSLLKTGRHFFIYDSLHAIIGRNQDENNRLMAVKNADWILTPADEKGPCSIIFEKKPCETAMEKCRSLVRRYSDNNPDILQYRIPG